MLDVPPAVSRLMAVGSRAHTPPIPVSPIGEVVAALTAGHGPVADLVPTQAAVAEPIVDEFIAFGGNVVIGFRDLAAGDASGEGGSILNDQRIRGHMVDASVEHFIERTLHVVVALSGSSVDQVQVDVVEPGGSRGECRCGTRTRRMRAL